MLRLDGDGGGGGACCHRQFAYVELQDAGMGAAVVQELVDRLAELRLAAPRKAVVNLLRRQQELMPRQRRLGQERPEP